MSICVFVPLKPSLSLISNRSLLKNCKNYANTTVTKLIIFMQLTLTFSKFCCEPQQVRYSVDDKGWFFGYSLLISCGILEIPIFKIEYNNHGMYLSKAH